MPSRQPCKARPTPQRPARQPAALARRARLALSALFALSALAALGCPASVAAATWQVQPGGSIQAAIAQAAAGDTIRVARARYAENLRIDKPLTLIGRQAALPSTGVARVTPSASPPKT
jgi:nitrous oxidase accessory protein NosD